MACFQRKAPGRAPGSKRKKRGPDGAVKHNRHHYTQKAHVSSEVFVATTNIDPPLEEANASTSDGLVRQGL